MAVRGGQNLTRYLIEFERNVGRGAKMRVGFLETAPPYPYGITKAFVASVNEFGAPSRNIPPRPFFRTTIGEKSHQWASKMGSLLRELKYDARAVYSAIGPAMVNDIKESIVKGDWTPNAPSTIKRKGFNAPLIDTTGLINAVDYEIE